MCSPTAGGLTNQGKNKERVEEAWDSHALDRRSQDFLLVPYNSHSRKHTYPILSRSSPPLTGSEQREDANSERDPLREHSPRLK